MKHEKIFKKVRKMIDEREVDDDNLEAARDELFELVEKDDACAWGYGLLSEINYWFGETADPEDKMAFYQEGVDCGETAVEIDEDSVEGNFWLAVNNGSYGQEKGIMKSLSLIQPIKTHAERVIELDETYFYGGPWRVLGRLYCKAPGFPISIGNVKKGVECLERAVELGPKFFLNRIFLAEAYIADRKKPQAREQLEWIMDNPPNKNHEAEDELIKRDAKAILSRI
jgi:tetratricopeptide (TPR) repeat protein